METLYSANSALVIDTSVKDGNVYFRVARRDQQTRKFDWRNAAVFTMAIRDMGKFITELIEVKNGTKDTTVPLQYTSPKGNVVKQMVVVVKDGDVAFAIKQNNELYVHTFDNKDYLDYFIDYVTTLYKNWAVISAFVSEMSKLLSTRPAQSQNTQKNDILDVLNQSTTNNQPNQSNQTNQNNRNKLESVIGNIMSDMI